MSKINENKTVRVDWIDQLRGFAIFLVVYGHNFPITEKYIYSFHMPLFIFLAGFFHPKKINKTKIVSRATRVLVPYFAWSIILYIVWFLFGRNYGESSLLDLSVTKNLIGVFYAQGGREFMDWGIPMWFLPSIFLTFLFFVIVEKTSGYLKYILLLLFVVLGFIIGFISNYSIFWSLDVALVSLLFYSMGYCFKNQITNYSYVVFLALGILHFFTFFLNDKIDMYRSQYGNILLFIVNGTLGILFYVGLFKTLPKIKVFSYLGRNTIIILATQLRAMTFIKLVFVVGLGVSVFNFSEIEKLLLSIIQILLILPVIYVVNKYIPVLNGFSKKNKS